MAGNFRRQEGDAGRQIIEAEFTGAQLARDHSLERRLARDSHEASEEHPATKTDKRLTRGAIEGQPGTIGRQQVRSNKVGQRTRDGAGNKGPHAKRWRQGNGDNCIRHRFRQVDKGQRAELQRPRQLGDLDAGSSIDDRPEGQSANDVNRARLGEELGEKRRSQNCCG